jgi:hypothetical protein
MIHTLLPVQHVGGSAGTLAEPQRRLMAAVLRAVVEDCRGGTRYRQAVGAGTIDAREVRNAIAYVASRDRSWPFSFENICDALGVDVGGLRRALAVTAPPDGSPCEREIRTASAG